MARWPQFLTTSGASVSAVYGLDYWAKEFNVSVQAIVTGTVVFSLEYTSDDIQASTFTPGAANWMEHPSMTDATESGFVQIVTPVTAIRINQASGAGSVRAAVIQQGMGG